MDGIVPRNNAEGVNSEQNQLRQVAALQDHIMNSIREYAVEHVAKQGLMEEARAGVSPKRKPRRKYKLKIAPQATKSGKLIHTVRELVENIPLQSGGVTVVYNPNTQQYGFQSKRIQLVEATTVAKPRVKRRGHTVIVSTKFDGPESGAEIMEMAEQEGNM